MTSIDRAAGFHFLRLLALCALIGSVFCAFAGAAAHFLSATYAQDLYSIAIGDHLLPPSPVDSWFWGPILIGAFVTWWVGPIAAPAIFWTAFVGKRLVPRWTGFLKASLGGWTIGAGVLVVLMVLENRRYPAKEGEWGNVLAAVVIQQGYWALVLGLVGMTAFLALGRRRNSGTVKEG